MKVGLRVLGPAVAALGALLVYAWSHRGTLEQHERFSRELHQLEMIDSTLNHYVLLARSHLLPDYDAFSRQFAAVSQTQAALAALAAAEEEPGRALFLAELAEFGRLTAQKEQLIESFKSDDAVLANSLRYLPLAVTDLRASLSQESNDLELQTPLNQLMPQMFVHSLLGGNEEEEAIQETLAQLAAWRASHSTHPQAAAVAKVAAHTASILRRKPTVEALTHEIIDLPTADVTAQLTHLHDAQLAANLRRSQVLQRGLAGICALLVLGIGSAIYALSVSNRNLERRVAERTRALQGEAAEHGRTASGLQLSEQRFRTLSASAPIGIFLTDPAGQALYCNPHWLGIAGLSLEESLGEGWQRAVHPEDGPALFAAWQSAATAGLAFHREFRFRTPAGEVRWVCVRTTAIHSGAGELTGHVGTAEDVTESRRTQEFLNSVLQHLPIGVFIKDAHELRFSLWNKANEDICGVSHQEAMGKNDHDLFGDEVAAGFVARDREVLNGGKLIEAEEEITTPHRGRRILNTRKIPILDGEGRPVYLLGISEDITARKQAEAQLEKMHGQLLETSRQAGMAEVAISVLHNVGNVLNSVNVSATLVADKVGKSSGTALGKVAALLTAHAPDLASFLSGDEKGKQIPGFLVLLAQRLEHERHSVLQEIGHLQRSVEHIKDIVSRQQSYSRISGFTETLQIAELMEDTLLMNAESFAHHEVRVVRDFAAVPPVTVEKHKVLQILINLVRNAKHACEAAGNLDKTMTLRVYNGEGTVKVAVSDNGVGIPPENLARIFNHGFTTKKNGHGFGLHSGALAAKEMGGRLTVESAGAGSGATFTLVLPAA